jgi:hypothetical protein
MTSIVISDMACIKNTVATSVLVVTVPSLDKKANVKGIGPFVRVAEAAEKLI